VNFTGKTGWRDVNKQNVKQLFLAAQWLWAAGTHRPISDDSFLAVVAPKDYRYDLYNNSRIILKTISDKLGVCRSGSKTEGNSLTGHAFLPT